VNFNIPPIAHYYTDDDEAIIAKQAELKIVAKRRQAELADIDEKIAKHGDVETQSETHVQNLIDGVEIERPTPLGAQRTSKQYEIRDVDMAENYIADKVRVVNITAGARLAKDIKPAADIAAKELADALVIAHEKHFSYWQAKRQLLNNGISLYGLFDSNVDDILGIPVDKGTPLADYFRDAVEQKHLRAVPKEIA
jgi:hypothetical protein